MSPAPLFWLDRSEHAQRLARDVIDQLRSHEARDELGLGSVRDVIADALSPGTSTIMTRARYYFFVPWMYRRLERLGRSRPEQVTEDVRTAEKALLRGLDAHELRGGFSGVIGRQTLKEHDALPQRLPSEIYWAGLRTLGILRTTIGRSRYHRQIVDHAYGEREDDGDGVASAWDPYLPVAPTQTVADSGFVLTAAEAAYLRDRIRATRQVPGILGEQSLLLWLAELPEERAAGLDNHLDTWRAAAEILDHPFLVESVEHARWLSQLLHGAQLVYNQLIERDFVQAYPARAEELGLMGTSFADAVTRWADGIAQDHHWFSKRDEAWFWSWRPLDAPSIPATTTRFITSWASLVRTHPQAALLDQAQVLVSAREMHLKGRSSRLSGLDPEQLKAFRGASGDGVLDFRWLITKRIASDIRTGLATVD